MKQRGKTNLFKLSDGTEVYYKPGQTVLEALIENQIEIGSVCGGMGSCGTCHVFIDAGKDSLAPRNEIELERALDLGFRDNERQACQIEANPNLIIRIP